MKRTNNTAVPQRHIRWGRVTLALATLSVSVLSVVSQDYVTAGSAAKALPRTQLLYS